MLILYLNPDTKRPYTVSAHFEGENVPIDGITVTRINVPPTVQPFIVKALNHELTWLHGFDGYCSHAPLINAEYNTYQRRSAHDNNEARQILKLMADWSKRWPEGVWQCV